VATGRKSRWRPIREIKPKPLPPVTTGAHGKERVCHRLPPVAEVPLSVKEGSTFHPVRARDVALAAATDRVVAFRFDSIHRTTCGRGRTSGGDDDLSAGVAVSEVADRLWNLVESERPIDDSLDRAGFEQLPQLFQVLAALL